MSLISFSALGVGMNIVVFGMVGAIIQVMLNIAFAPSLVHDINSFKLTFLGKVTAVLTVIFSGLSLS